MKLLCQHLLHIYGLLPGRPGRKLELRRRNYRIGNQEVVLGLEYLRFLPLTESDSQGLAQLLCPLFGQGGEGYSRLVVDDLDHANQFIGPRLKDRSDQYLLSTVSSALIDLQQKTQIGVVRL